MRMYIIAFGICLQACAAHAQLGPEWAAFQGSNVTPGLADKLHSSSFDDIGAEGPWKASADARPDDAQSGLMNLLMQAKWTQAQQWLQQHRLDLNKPDIDGRTPLTLAARQGQLMLVRDMLRRGADTHQAGLDGMTPLGAAAFGGHESVVRELLRAHTKVDQPDLAGQLPMHHAVAMGHVRVMRLLMAAGADWRSFNREGYHAVSWAALHGRLEVLEALQLLGVPLAQKDANRLNAAHAAAVAGQLSLVRWLQARGVQAISPITQLLIDRLPLPACTAEAATSGSTTACQWYPLVHGGS